VFYCVQYSLRLNNYDQSPKYLKILFHNSICWIPHDFILINFNQQLWGLSLQVFLLEIMFPVFWWACNIHHMVGLLFNFPISRIMMCYVRIMNQFKSILRTCVGLIIVAVRISSATVTFWSPYIRINAVFLIHQSLCCWFVRSFPRRVLERIGAATKRLIY